MLLIAAVLHGLAPSGSFWAGSVLVFGAALFLIVFVGSRLVRREQERSAERDVPPATPAGIDRPREASGPARPPAAEATAGLTAPSPASATPAARFSGGDRAGASSPSAPTSRSVSSASGEHRARALQARLVKGALIGFIIGWLGPVACAAAQAVPRSSEDWSGMLYVALVLLFPAGGLGALLGFALGLVSRGSD